jgi:hypothetical protein
VDRSAAVRAFVALVNALKLVVLVVDILVDDEDLPHPGPGLLRDLQPIEIPTFVMPSIDPR